MSTKSINTTQLKNKLFFILPSILIWILGLLFIGDNTAIKIIGDEFGYWTAGAWISGKDWSDVASLNSYYGYGYGIILSFLLRLPFSPLVEYKLAIVLNILILNVVYFIIYYLLNDSQLFEKQYVSALIALTSTLYTGNTFHSQFTMSETIILLLFWLFILLLYSLNKKYRFCKTVLGAILFLCMYTTHLRTFGIICIGIVCLLLIQLKNKRFFNAILFLLLTVGLLMSAEQIKTLYQNLYLSSEYSNKLYYNDYSGQVSSVKYVFTQTGFYRFIIGFIGKVFYILSSTYLLAGIAVCHIIKNSYKYIRQKKLPKEGALQIIILLCAVASVSISSIYLLIYEARFDFLIYGRYNEFFISSLILLGLVALFHKQAISLKEIITLIVIYLFTAAIVLIELPLGNVVDCTFINSAGIYETLSQYNRSIPMLLGKSILIFLFLVFFTYKLKTTKKALFIAYACILLSFCWSSTYIYDYQFGILSWARVADQQEIALANYIQELDCEDKLYYFAAEGNIKIEHLQFLIEDIPIMCIYTDEQLESIPTDCYLLTPKATVLTSNGSLNSYKALMQSNRLILWKKNK